MMRVTRKVRLRSSCLLCIAAQSNNLLQFILLFYPVHSAILFLSMYLHYMWYGHAFSVLYTMNLLIKTLL
jgi:hypothetical protein